MNQKPVDDVSLVSNCAFNVGPERSKPETVSFGLSSHGDRTLLTSKPTCYCVVYPVVPGSCGQELCT